MTDEEILNLWDCNKITCGEVIEIARADERTNVIDLVDRHLWNYSKEVWADFQPVLEQLKEQNR